MWIECRFALREIEFAWFWSSTIFTVVRVCVELTVHVCHYVRLINQCGLYVDKINILKKVVGAAYIQVRSIDRKLRYLATFTQNLKVIETTSFFLQFILWEHPFFCLNTENYLGLRGWCPWNYLVWIGLNHFNTYHDCGLLKKNFPTEEDTVSISSDNGIVVFGKAYSYMCYIPSSSSLQRSPSK